MATLVLAITKMMGGIINLHHVLLAKASSNEESNNVQEPKSDTRSSLPHFEPHPEPENDENDNESPDEKHSDTGIGDATAESQADPTGSPEMRTRSDRSSKSQKLAKGRSLKAPTRRKEIQRDLRVLSAELDKYVDVDGKYNGIVRLIDSNLLKYSYSLIKSKPGNMTKGSSSQTLDRISNSFFEDTAKDILEGRFKFEPARMIEIPKPNKPGAVRK